jgi:hypothetical protein
MEKLNFPKIELGGTITPPLVFIRFCVYNGILLLYGKRKIIHTKYKPSLQ